MSFVASESFFCHLLRLIFKTYLIFFQVLLTDNTYFYIGDAKNLILWCIQNQNAKISSFKISNILRCEKMVFKTFEIFKMQTLFSNFVLRESRQFCINDYLSLASFFFFRRCCYRRLSNFSQNHYYFKMLIKSCYCLFWENSSVTWVPIISRFTSLYFFSFLK